MDIDKMAKEALARVNKHIDKLVKKHQREMKKQFDKKEQK
jgi:hypothetical protein